MKKSSWNAKKSNELYHVSGWGSPYFFVNRSGDLCIQPKDKYKKPVSLRKLVDEIVERGIQTPFLLRFNDILVHRLLSIQSVFQTASREFSYKGGFSTIYPIKVNQQRHVVEQIEKACSKQGHGLEAGSKPELLAVLAMTQNKDTPIVCNGYKDEEYFEIALMASKIGKRVFPVIEKFSEFQTLIRVSRRLKIKPEFGVRIKLSVTGSGQVAQLIGIPFQVWLEYY